MAPLASAPNRALPPFKKSIRIPSSTASPMRKPSTRSALHRVAMWQPKAINRSPHKGEHFMPPAFGASPTNVGLSLLFVSLYDVNSSNSLNFDPLGPGHAATGLQMSPFWTI